MKVIKRNGEKVPFEKSKIAKAIEKAYLEVFPNRQEEALKCGKRIANDIYHGYTDPLSVEEIQNKVERDLILHAPADVARAYIRYRYKRELLRKSNTTDKAIKELLDGESEFWNKENSNKNAKWVTTQRDYLAGITSKDIARRFIFPKKAIEAHDAGIIHIHDMDYMAQSTMHNCFSVDTEFITQEGVKSFKDFYDGAPVIVRDKDGMWRSAVVHNFGKQVLYTITLQSGRSVKEVRCTRNHRWILSDGSITENLQIGDTLYPLVDVASNYEPKTIEELQAFCLGFVLGDGTDISNSRGVRVRLCGHKKDDYLKYFEQAGYQIAELPNNSDVVATNKDVFSKQVLLDSRAWKVMSSTQKIALFNGYYAADGCLDRNAIHTSDERALELITELAPVAGYYIASVRHDIHETPYKKNASLYKIAFRKKNNKNNLWKVKNIQKSYNNNHKNNVWCVVEPITHTFTLASGIITGNCCLINLEDMLQNGTVVNGITIDKPHRLSTAMTIATQIIAAVASSQYGGCTINLAHLAPFVKDSYDIYFKKYYDWGFKKELCEKCAMEDTKREVKDAVQTLNYQLNSLTTTNGQSPFVSIFMYIKDAGKFERELVMLIEEIFLQRIQGMKNKVGVYITPAFPKLLYVLEDDNITSDSKYWWLTELAAKCTAKRMVPDYISEKIMKRDKLSLGEKIGEGDVYGCMGK